MVRHIGTFLQYFCEPILVSLRDMLELLNLIDPVYFLVLVRQQDRELSGIDVQTDDTRHATPRQNQTSHPRIFNQKYEITITEQ